MYDYNNNPTTINQIKTLITKQDEQIRDMNLMRDCLVDKLYKEIKSVQTFPWCFTEKFYYAINNYLKGNTDADDNPKTSYEWALENIKSLYPNAKEITEIIFVGFNTHAVNIRFNLIDDDDIYSLYVPIPQNISRSDVEYDGWDNQHHINYDIAQFAIYKKSSECSWDLIWKGYNLDDFRKENI